jgi:hypothetical protein
MTASNKKTFDNEHKKEVKFRSKMRVLAKDSDAHIFGETLIHMLINESVVN